MSQVTLTVGPRSYTVNCADGEEDHIARLAAMIDEKYALLGAARTPQESQNIFFAALFLADELAEARRTAAKSGETVAHEKERSNGKTEAMRTEIETLTKAEARAREEIAKLKSELANMREKSRHQHDLFGDAGGEDEIAETLEKLASRAEKIAAQIESRA
jgi:cell division protein ZapA